MKIPFKGHYLNGAFYLPAPAPNIVKSRTSLCPGDLSDKIMEWTEDISLIETACEKGKEASLSWTRIPLEEKKTFFLKLKAIFQKKSQKLTEVIARETGKPLWEARMEARSLAGKVDVTLHESLKLIQETRILHAAGDVFGCIRFRPRGLMAVIGPFNFPMHLPNGQILAALLAGNTVIFKPSEKTPACGQLLTECLDEAGFPEGALQMIQGGGEVSARLCENPLVDGILFTGSFATGEKIRSSIVRHYHKILALEMGGKNSTLIWDCENLDQAVSETLKGCFWTTGQRCSSTSRIILNKTLSADFKRDFIKKAEKLSVGHWKENPFMGPLIDEKSVQRFFHYQENIIKEGGKCLLEGQKLQRLHGYYVTPGIYELEFNSHSAFQTEETFTPQVGIYEVDTLEAALNIVHHSGYGLALSLFSENKQIQEEIFHRAKVGLLNYNRSTCGASARMPFGGMGRSGNDRPGGVSMITSCVTPVSLLKGK